MIQIIEEAKNIQEEMVFHRRHLHKNPEIGLDLPLTVEYVKSKLIEYGYEPKMCAGGLVAQCGTGAAGKTFLLRGDMDALPIKEEVESDFRADNGNMHACGHDMHTSMLLGCAKILKAREDEIQGTVKLMFQPGEEVARGAKLMIEAGVLNNPDVDGAMMLHVFAGMPKLKDGQFVLLSEGPASANVDVFRINVKGKGGHGGRPQETVDPINVCAHIHLSLQALNAREVEPSETVVVTIGEMQCGDTHNVIPDKGYMRGNIRSYGPETRVFLKQRLVEMAESVAKTFRAEAEVVFEHEAPSVIIEPQLRRDVLRNLKELFGDDVQDGNVYLNGAFGRLTGGEDFGYVSEAVPSLLIGLIAGVAEDGHQYPPHHPKVTFNEDILWKGASAYAYTALRWLEEH